MKIDEAVFERAFGGRGHEERAMARQHIDRYLSALPSAEPGRDRSPWLFVSFTIAGERCSGVVQFDRPLSTPEDFQALANAVSAQQGARVRLAAWKRLEPVEVEGSVEGVGP